MMKLLLIGTLLCYFGHVLGAPALNSNVMSSPAFRAIMDMLQKAMLQNGNMMPPKLTKPIPPLPPMPAAFNPPTPPRRPSMPPVNNNNGLFMNMPAGTGGMGGAAGYGMNYVYCPPGPTSSDSCKEQKLNEAFYTPQGSPRYDWVPLRNPYDSSIPDSVKDTARNILLMKVNTRPNRMMSPKEREILSYL